MQRCLRDRRPAIKLAVSPVIPVLESFGRNTLGPVGDVARIVEAPISGNDAVFAHHAGVELSAWIWRHDVKCRGCDAMIDRPVNRTAEDIVAILVHAEDEASIDHDAE